MINFYSNLIDFSILKFLSSKVFLITNSYPIVHSLLIFALFLIFFALDPNLKVERVSDMLVKLGEHVIMSVVFEFPPKDSERILVSLESR